MPLSAYLHTVDLCVLFYCRASGELKLLLNKREAEPFAGHWALPGVVVNGGVQDLSLKDAVERLRASDKVGFDLAWSEQVGTVGDAFRDPRCWSSSTYYLAIVADDVALGEHQAWFSLNAVADGSIKLPFDHNLIASPTVPTCSLQAKSKPTLSLARKRSTASLRLRSCTPPLTTTPGNAQWPAKGSASRLFSSSFNSPAVRQ